MQGVGLAWVFAVKAAKKGAKLVILRERKKVEAQGLHLLLETEDLVDASAVDLTFARPVEQVGGSLSGSIEAEPSSGLFFLWCRSGRLLWAFGKARPCFGIATLRVFFKRTKIARQAAWSRPLPRQVSLISHRATLLGSISRHFYGRVRWALRWLLVNANISSNLGSIITMIPTHTTW